MNDVVVTARTGWLKIKYPARQYAISSQPVVRFQKFLKLFNPDTSLNPTVYMYLLHLNYTTTLSRKTITMKITIFIIVLVLKSNETSKFDISDCHSTQLANSSKPCENSLFEDVFKVSAPSFHTSSKSFDKAQYGLVDGVLW